jgi:hypothetical protein
MRNHARPILAATLVLVFAGSTGALAAGALGGRTYEGSAPSMGVDSHGHKLRTHASGNIVLRVARNGRSVSIHFGSAPILYCVTQQQVRVQSTKPASISKSGSFRASVGERFAPGPGAPAIEQVVTGQFSGGTVRGTVRTQAAECSGTASFSAAAR